MLGIKVNNEFLDLLPGSAMDIEQNNPYLQFDDNILGDYSLPIEVPATAKNLRLLNYAGLIQTKITNTGIEASAYHSGFQHSTGKLKIEKPTIHLNNGKRGRISCYYLIGVSSFYQDAKNKRLKDADLGGNRTFTNDNFVRSGSGFWGHIHKVIDAPAGYGASGYDYAFFPVYNASFGRRPASDEEVINLVAYSGGTVNFTKKGIGNDWLNIISPFAYVKYVLKQAVAYCGWRIEGDILDDVDFCKATMINSLAINWGYLKFLVDAVIMFGSIKFNLADHMPDVSIPEFLIALKNRFGWWYDFDRKNKVIKIKPLINVAQNTIKDFSKYANPVVIKKVNNEKKIYALQSGGAEGISFTGVNLQADVETKADLPTAVEALASQVHLVIDENNYYICEIDETENWVWVLFSDGAGSYKPADATEAINTAALLPGVVAHNSYLDFIPQWDEFGYWPGQGETVDYSAAIVLAFYFGKINNKSSQPVPFASHHIYDSNGNQVAQWSLAFKGKKLDGTEVGQYDRNFKKFLDTLNATEEFEVVLNLPLVHYLSLSFSDIININNVRMYVKVVKASIPYKGSITVEGLRV
jgi:hypothetical protein